MIKKTVGFICPVDKPVLLDDLNKPLGGAETWTLQMALEFAKHNYHVVIFNKTETTMLYNNDVEICSLNLFENRAEYQKFEHIFILRFFDAKVLNIIKTNKCCDNIYFVLHDIYLWNSYKFDETAITSMNDLLADDWYLQHIRKIFVMSDWHKSINSKHINADLLYVLGNGTNIDVEENNNRDNSIFWSSCYNRGLDILVEKIAPKVIKEIPDFKIYTATYDSVGQKNKFTNKDYVIDLGTFNKQDLYKEISKHKVWFLPGVHWETFCITAIENIINNVEIVVPYKYGMQTYLKYFNHLLIKDGSYDNEEYCQYVSDRIIDNINNYNDSNKQAIRKIMKNYITDNYSWESIFIKIHNFIKQYETDNSNNC